MNASQESELATEKVGTVVDRRYRITGLLGRGGMGSVYRAEHVRLRRPVAVKLLHPEFLQVEEIAKRFEREAFATGRITHPNIVTVSDFGELEDGTLFLVMELLDGVSLGDVLAEETRLAPARALAIIKHVLRGLGHAHRSEIIHRDVKPENVILVEHAGDAEFAKLLDFGIAKLMGETEAEAGGEKLTQAGVAFGTPAYISPEQATGSSLDARADLYSTSVVLFEMLAGRPPFVDEDKLKLLAQHATRPVPRFAEVAPDIELPDGLEEIVRRGLEKHPDNRWGSAEDYVAAIEAYEKTALSRQAETPVPPPAAVDTGSLPAHSPERSEAGASAARGVEGSPELSNPAMQTHTTGMTIAAPDARKRNWLIGGLVTFGIVMLVLILANAARSSSDSGKQPAVKAAIAVLEKGDSCAERKKAVATLRDLGDPSAIAALEKAARRRGNRCLTRDARAAIRALSAEN